MQKQTAGMLAIVMVVFLLMFSGAYYFMYYKKSSEQSAVNNKPKSETSIKSTAPSEEKAASNSGLQVKGVNTPETQNKQTSATAQLPKPEEFEVYEQYALSETAQYQEILVGTGQEALEGDTLAVVYKGWLTDGTQFDQNRVNDQNQIELFVFQLGAHKVVPGWEQTVYGMKEGGKRRLVIPAKLGYGEMGQGPIPPNSMLIFDVELVQVQKQ